MNKKILLIAAFAFLLPFTSNADSKEESNDIVRYDYSFPRDIEEYDDSILTNSSQKFYYDDDIEDQINISNYENADVFVNGKAVESDDEAKNLIQEGKNTVDILNVRDTVDVKIKSGKEEKGFNNSNNKLDQKVTALMETLLDEEVKENFSGGQISVIRDNEEIYDYNFGYVNNFEKNGEAIPYEDRVEVDENTLFDLASNTKMYVTNYSLQKLVYEGKINIDDKVSKYFPEFKDDEKSPIKGKNEMTIRDILRHQAGFPADPQYHNNNYDKDDGNKNGVNDLFSQDREKTLDMVMRTPLSYEPGSKSVYSDVDYMLLGFIVEKVTGQRLDKYFAENFAKPLNLRYTLFNPLENGFDKNQVAATELNGNTRDGAVDFLNIRKDTIQGEVHDEKAYYSMAGVSGHAGLFSNSRELAKLANIMLNEGRYKNIRFWDKKTQDEFTKASEVNPSYGLGWRRMADGKYAWAFSNLASSNTIGHTGWTGTLTVIDPLERMTFVLLTNKKNGFVLDNKENPNYFYTDASMSGGYGAVSTLIYKALQDNSKELVMALANELQIGQERMLKDREGYLNEAELNDYIAIKNTNQIIKEKYKNTSEDSISIDDKKADHDNLEKTSSESAYVKSSNPKTGIDGLIPLLGLAISSAFAYRKIKR
ncbi:MAG: penicillin binding protein PBP4B [Anaerococcus prevotii]|nr:penicillin binding protein PBP4B [Anaerococcus prevotii]